MCRLTPKTPKSATHDGERSNVSETRANEGRSVAGFPIFEVEAPFGRGPTDAYVLRALDGTFCIE